MVRKLPHATHHMCLRITRQTDYSMGIHIGSILMMNLSNSFNELSINAKYSNRCDKFNFEIFEDSAGQQWPWPASSIEVQKAGDAHQNSDNLYNYHCD